MFYSDEDKRKAQEMYENEIAGIYRRADGSLYMPVQGERDMTFNLLMSSLILSSWRYYQLYLDKMVDKVELSAAEQYYMKLLYDRIDYILHEVSSDGKAIEPIDPTDFRIYSVEVKNGELVEPWRELYVKKVCIPNLLQYYDDTEATCRNIMIGCALAAVVGLDFEKMPDLLRASLVLAQKGGSYLFDASWMEDSVAEGIFSLQNGHVVVDGRLDTERNVYWHEGEWISEEI